MKLEDNLEKILKNDFYKICDETDLIKKAELLVSILFLHKLDKSNEPYVNHLYRVSDSCDTVEEKIVALLHDTLEDTKVTYKDLILLGFPRIIVDSVYILTKKSNETYEEYIQKVLNSNNKVVLKVKYKDMLDNSNEKRLSKLDEETRNRLVKKYSCINKIKERLENSNDRY